MDRLSGSVQCNLAHAAVIPGIGTIYVAREAAAQQHVVEARVELDAVLGLSAAHFQFTQLPAPLVLRSLAGGIKVQSGSFGLQIGLRILHGRVGQAQLHRHLGGLRVVQGQHRAGAGNFRGRCAHAANVEGRYAIGHRRHLTVEIHAHGSARLVLLHVGRFRDDRAAQNVSFQLRVSVADGAALAHAGTYIHQDVALAGTGESEALETHALRRRELGLHAVVLEHHRIVTRAGILIGLVKRRSPALGRVLQHAGNRDGLPGYRHEGQTAHLELVETGKSVNGGVRVLIAYGLPSLVVAIGSVGGCAQLGHAKRRSGRRVHKPAAVHRTDVRVYIIQQILLRATGHEGKKCQKG